MIDDFESDWIKVSGSKEKIANKNVKKLLYRDDFDEVINMTFYKRSTTSSGRPTAVEGNSQYVKKDDIKNKSTRTDCSFRNEKEEKKEVKKRTRPTPQIKFTELNTTNEDVQKMCDICLVEESNPDYADNNTSLYRLISDSVYMEKGFPHFTLTDKDATSNIGRGIESILEGRNKKFAGIVNNNVVKIKGVIRNHPTREAMVDYDYKKGNISDPNVENTKGPRGGKSPLYFYDSNPNKPNQSAPTTSDSNSDQMQGILNNMTPEQMEELMRRYLNR